MTVLEILSYLRKHGARVWLAGQEVRYRGPRELFTESLRAELKEREEEIREFLSLARSSRGGERIERRPAGEPPMLSSGQERLWFLHQLQPDSPVYNVPLAVEIGGPFSPAAMGGALSALARRHEVLRAVFPTDADGRPAVRILEPAGVPLPVIDLRALPADRRRAEAEKRLKAWVQRPFDLASGPLWRALVTRIEDELQILTLSQHHIVVDGWSLGVLLREIAGFYGSPGGPTPPPLAVGYFDYAAWQRRRLQGGDLASNLDYWVRSLQGASGELGLPLDRPRGTGLELEGGKVRVSLAAETIAGARALGKEQGATLFMILLTVFKILLVRLGAGEDLSLGSPVANRSRTELEPLIGFFVNTVVLRSHLRRSESGLRALARVKETCVEAFARQDFPFERLVEELQPDRGLARTPLFEALFVLQNLPQERVDAGDVWLRPLRLETGTAKFDLTLSLMEVGSRVEGTLEYRRSIFDHTTARRWAGQLSNLAASLIAEPRRPVDELPILSPAERWQLVGEWGLARSREENAGPTLVELFRLQAERTPDRVAVRSGVQRLSYGELRQRVDLLAEDLRALGMGCECLVGLWADRSLDLVVGMLGILHTGAGYLPLDPVVPEERRRFMLLDAGVGAVVGPREELGDLASEIGIPLVSPPVSVEKPANVPEILECSTDLATAYVMYTSGSTGRPKGVAISHRQVVRLFTHTRSWLEPGPEDVWSLFHSPAFDFSVWEIWGALLHGGTLLVVSAEVCRDPASFRQLLADAGVSVLSQTPSAFRQLIAADQEVESPLERLRFVVFGGEALSFASLARWVQRYGDGSPRLINMYGITETTVHVTYRRVRAHEVESATGSWIGRPIPDLDLLVLDRLLRPVPIGVAGELVVGGGGLATRYWNRPALTARKLVPDPYSSVPGQRLYRSGDLARFLGTGELEYLGRIDHQVKIRGFRIELGEIEARLAEMSEVSATVVVPWKHREAQRLVAYLVPVQSGELPVREELRRRLERVLPEYMIPSRFVVLDKIPLTVNGKVDRRALPAPSDGVLESRRAFEPPLGDTENLLAAVLAEVLGLGEVGRHDNFFELGCDSITCVRVVARARQEGLDLELTELFRHQTVADLAAASADHRPVSGRRQTGAFELISEAVRNQLPDDVTDAYPLARLQAGMFFHDAFRLEERVYQNVHQITLAGDLDPEALEKSLADLCARHPVLRTSFELLRFDPPLQLVHGEVEIPCQRHDLRQLEPGARSGRVDAIFRQEGEIPFDPSRQPLIRFHLLRVEDRRWVLGWSFHHALLDGWSLATLLTELFGDYLRHAGQRQGPSLQPPATTFRDFLALEQEALDDASAREYFDEVVAELPDGRLLMRPEESGIRGQGQIVTALERGLAARLQGLAQDLGVPLKTLLLAAHLRVVALLTGERRAASGVLVHGRPETSDSDRTLGLFVNAVPLMVPLPNGCWRDLIAATFAAETRLLRHRRYPFASLERHSGSSGALDFLFNYLNFHVLDAVDRLPGLRLVDLRNSGRTSVTLATTFRRDAGGGLTLLLEYQRDRLSATRVQGFAALYLGALEAVGARPDSLHSQGWVPRRAIEDVLTWSGSPGLAGAPLVSEVWKRRARESPDAVAVVDGERTTSYGQLSLQVGELAGWLRRRLLDPRNGRGEIQESTEPTVGFLGGSSTELVVTLLATLEAGVVFVSLDPAHPPARLAQLAEESGLRLWIAAAGQKTPIPGVPGRRLHLSASGAALEGEGPEDLPAPRRVSAAYLLFTSGTSGPPKGVVVSQGDLADHLEGARGAYGLKPADRVAQLASPGFDVALEQILTTLSTGACLVLREQRVPTGPALDLWVERQRLTVVNLAPALFSLWTAARRSSTGDDLRLVIVGGEALSISDLRRWQAKASGSGIVVVNAYGPTECVITASCQTTGGGDDPVGGCVPLGRPLPGRWMRVLDPCGQRVPPGAPGQLWLGGILARGYLGRPALTAERFRPDPWSPDPGGRIYASGDRVAWTEEGRLEFLGRYDQQLKLRGLRLEPGEIENQIAGLEEIRQAVVGIRADGGEKRLVAYAVAEQGSEPGPPRLIRQLRKLVPDALVPRVWCFLDHLPLTVSGKIDRRALETVPLPDLQPSAGVAPRSDLERLLVEELGNLFARRDITADSDFFVLGGHSLLAARFAARLQERLEIDLPVEAIFEHPNAVDLAAYLERAGDEAKRKIAAPALERHSSRGPTPLSFSQERIWFLQQLQPLSTAYNVPVVLRLRGSLRVEALEDALNDLVAHHEVLRTRFEVRNGQPVQIVEPEWSVRLHRVDLSGLTAELAESAWRTAQHGLGARPFDLRRLPLLRGVVFAAADGGAWLRLELHHVIVDGWSMGIFHQQLVAAYEARCRGHRAELPALEIQYRDYSAWQRSGLEGAEQKRSMEYWRQQLEGAPPELGLPRDRPDSALEIRPAGHRGVDVGPELATSWMGFARRSRATRFMVGLAAFAGVLGRTSHSRDVVVGTATAGRDRRELEEMIGCFVHTVALRIRWQETTTFGDLVAEARRVVLEAFARPWPPFELLVDRLQVERVPGRSPLFQVSFLLQERASLGEVRAPELSLTPRAAVNHHAKLDLTLAFEGRGRNLSGQLEYDAGRWDGSTMSRLGRSFGLFLEAALRAPDKPVDSLPMVSRAEEHQLLVEWNDNQKLFGLQNPLHQLVRRAAEANPDRIVLCGEGLQLSAASLVGAGRYWARRLRSAGIGVEDRVGILMPRSPEVVISMLAALEVGATYVPLDPLAPEERIASLLEDAEVRVVLVAADGGERVPARYRGPVLVVGGAAAAEPGLADAETFPVDPLAGAYQMYTSGSTGQPKGVVISHRAIVHHMEWMRSVRPLARDDRVLFKTSPVFDASVWEVWAPLLEGARLEVAEAGLEGRPAALLDLVARRQITVLQVVPTLLGLLLETRSWPGCDSLRRMYCGGEQLPGEHVRRFFALGLGAELINVYGPTEATIHASWGLCGEEQPLAEASVGRPVENTRLRLVDQRLRPVGMGAVGELVVAGPGLARGYHRRPAQTAAAFVPDPVSGSTGERMYRTGDLARFLPDGRLQIVGRRDHQVKIRGMRIEPGEVQSVLAGNPGLREVAVVPGRYRGDLELVAYVVPRTRPAVVSDLRQWLGERLPPALVPSLWVALDELPKLPSGKLDRGRLPPPDARPSDTRHLSPRNELELRISELWKEVLGLPDLGVEDSFFEMGGHSLLAVRLLSRIEEAFGQAVSLTAFFAAPSVAGLARLLRTKKDSTPRYLVELSPGRVPDPARELILIHPAGGEASSYRHLAELLGVERKVRAFRSPGLEPGEDTVGDLRELASLYLAELLQTPGKEPYHLLGWSTGGAIAFEMARQLHTSGAAATLVLVDSRSPDSKPPLPEAELEQSWLFLRNLASSAGVSFPERSTRQLLDAETVEDFWVAVVAMAREKGLLGESEGLAFLRRLEAVFLANVRAEALYSPGELNVPTLLVRARDHLGPERLNGDRGLGWGKWISTLESEDMPGDHYSLLRPPAVEALATRALHWICGQESRLSRARGTRGGGSKGGSKQGRNTYVS